MTNATYEEVNAAEHRRANQSRARRYLRIALAIVLLIVPLLGGFIVARLSKGTWYNEWKTNTTRDKSQYEGYFPPAFVFSVGWSVMYVLMAIASILVARTGCNKHTVVAMVVYIVHVLISWTYTPAFFGFQHYCSAHSIIAMLFGMSVCMVVVFWPISIPASLLMVPHMLWLVYLTVFNQVFIEVMGGCGVHNSTLLGTTDTTTSANVLASASTTNFSNVV